MSCDFCDHTMQLMSVEPKVFYCPRCGSTRTVHGPGLEVFESPFWIMDDSEVTGLPRNIKLAIVKRYPHISLNRLALIEKLCYAAKF